MKTRIGRTAFTYVWLGALVLALGIHLALGILAGMTRAERESREGQESATATARVESQPLPLPLMPKSEPVDAPGIFFPDAGETDHNESANGQMKGDSQEFLSAMPGAGAAERKGVPAGVYDAMGVGGGAGGAQGGRRNLQARGGGMAMARVAQPGGWVPDREGSGSEEYLGVAENSFVRVANSEPSTFSIDVDTASYSNIRRITREGRMPPADAVRIEEMLNAFKYEDDIPRDGAPFAVTAEAHPAPWARDHRLVRIGLRAMDIDISKAPPANLVFLVDVSGSMSGEERLPLVKRCLKLMVEKLRPQDHVSLVTYAGSSGLALDATPGSKKAEIVKAIDGLGAGGSTNGAGGIHRAYETAQRHFIEGGINRVLLCTDGDFNVGVSDRAGLGELVAKKRETGVFLSVMGFGTGNLGDARMQELAQKGNGNAAYIDSFSEGRRVFQEQMAGTLLTVAKDVKIQVEFNPAEVESYRLIGYETRMLAAKDFADDKKDAGEIGAGHQVVALYEVVPVTHRDPLADPTAGDDLCTIRLRYKPADGDVSSKIEFSLGTEEQGKASPDFDFAAAVAACGMLLKDSPHRGTATWGLVQELAQGGVGFDPGGARAEFVDLVKTLRSLADPPRSQGGPSPR